MINWKEPTSIYYSQSFLSQLLMMMAFTVTILYQVQVVGMSALELVIVGTVLELTIFLFEIPTGLIADYKGRKYSIILGYMLIGIGFLIAGLFPYFVFILLSQVCWGIGYTCISGAHQAWITDEIGVERVDKAFLRSAKFGNFGSLLGIPIAIVIGFQALHYSIILSGVGFLLLAILSYRYMPENHFNIQRKEASISVTNEMKSMLASVWAAFKKNKVLRYILIIACIIGVYSEGFDRLWIPHLTFSIDEKFLTNEYLILIVGGLQFITALLTIVLLQTLDTFVDQLHLKRLYQHLLVYTSILMVTLLSFGLATNIYLLAILFVLIQVVRQIIATFENIWFNKLITDSSRRATFFSFKGQIDAIGQIGGGPVIGVIGQQFSIKLALVASAILLSPVFFIYRKLLKTKD